MEYLESLVYILRDVGETLKKIERNQRLHTKVVLGERTFTAPFHEVMNLTPGEINEKFGRV